MSNDENIRAVTLSASASATADIRARRFVAITTAGAIIEAGANADAIGVALSTYDDSQFEAGLASREITIAVLDGCKVGITAGGTVVAGDKLKSDAQGRAVAATSSGDRVLGYALTGGAIDTEIQMIASKQGTISALTLQTVAAGEFTTVGGDVTESITIVGVLATDVAIVTVGAVGATPVTILTATAAVGAITVTLSGDPADDHVLNYVVLRA